MQAIGVKPGTEEGRAIAAGLRMLSQTSELPGIEDTAIAIPPVLRAWSRRLGTRNLWLLYRFDSETITAFAVTASPPVPIE